MHKQSEYFRVPPYRQRIRLPPMDLMRMINGKGRNLELFRSLMFCLFVFRVGLAGGSEEINEIQMYSFGMRQNLNPLINIETNFSATGCSCLMLGIWFDCALRWSVGLFWIGRWRHLFVPNVCKKRSVGLPQYFISYKIDEHGQHCYIHNISSFYQKYYHINFFSTCYMKG